MLKSHLALLFVLLNLVMFTAPAEATINVKSAKVRHGVAVIRGNKAIPNADIYWEGARVTQANKAGNFSFSGVIPADCVGTLSDGTPIEVVVPNCTDVIPGSVAATGQVLCYAANGSGTIPCAGTGQDGELQNGVVLPVPRFTDNSDGTITDNLTGLIWLKEANCFGAVTWSQALSSASDFSNANCNLSDGSVAGEWRVPNVRELRSLVDYDSSQPALPSGHPFVNLEPGVGGNYPYWTSTTNAGSWFNAWVVSFGVGGLFDSNKPLQNYVLPVRGGF